MKAIIPLAGKGTRLRPHTYSRPKPLMHVAGKPILGHIIDFLNPLNIDEFVFITGDMEDQIKEYVEKNYDCKTSYVKQDMPLGDGHALYLAKDNIDKDVVICFNDTLFITDIKSDVESIGDADGIVWSSKTEDPKRFGILEIDNGIIKGIEEKPKNPKSDLAIIGLYYFRDAKIMFEYLEKIQKEKVTSKGEYRLADAMALMVKDGKKLISKTVRMWLDTGKKETLLDTNKYLLENGFEKNSDYEDDVIKPPVYIEEGVEIINSVIGPFVSVAKGTKIHDSVIENSLIGEDTVVKNANLKDSIIGNNAQVKLEKKKLDVDMKLNVGDTSQIS